MFAGSTGRKRTASAWNTDWLVEIARARESTPDPPKPTPDPQEDRTTAKGTANEDDDDDVNSWVDPDSDPDHDNMGAASGGGLPKPSERRKAGLNSWSTWDPDPSPPPSPKPSTHSHSSDDGHYNFSWNTQATGGRPSGSTSRGNKKPIPNPPDGAPKNKKSKGKHGGRKGNDSMDSGWGNKDTTSSTKLQSELQDALNAVADYKQMTDILTSANDDLIIHRNLLQTQITDFSEIIESKDSEITSLREQLDQAHFKLRKAERRNRYVDDSDRWKADAKYRKKQKDATTMLFGFPSYEPDQAGDEILKERRGAQGLVAKSVTVVTGMMNRFNEELFQTAASCSDLVENQGFEKASMSSASRERADRVLGTRLVSMILPTIPRDRFLNPIVVQITIQAFLLYWCNSIIEAWYPKQETFAEFLVDVASKLKVGTNANICGKNTVITQKHTRESDNLFGDWVKEIIEDLCDVLSIFGWKISGYNPSSPGKTLSTLAIHGRLLSLVKDAYDIRTAMAEISTSGDVDLVIVSCDTPFDREIMEDAYGDRRTKVRRDLGADEIEGAFEGVVATTGIGLQREILKPHEVIELITRDIEMVLRPRVVLEYTLLEAFQ